MAKLFLPIASCWDPPKLRVSPTQKHFRVHPAFYLPFCHTKLSGSISKAVIFGPDTSLILDPQLSRVTFALADMARHIQRNDTLPIMVVKDNEEFIRSYTQHSVLSLMESMSTISFKSTELAATTRHVA